MKLQHLFVPRQLFLKKMHNYCPDTATECRSHGEMGRVHRHSARIVLVSCILVDADVKGLIPLAMVTPEM